MTFKHILLSLIGIYRQYISPLFPPSCRFQPTCSEYALGVIERFGTITGTYLAIKRILRCHPFHQGGYDPIPSSLEDMVQPKSRKQKNS
jgi:hypothetical protein